MPELDEVISFEEVCMAIKSMKPCKSPGVDRISTEVYKALPDHLVQLLTKIFKRNPCYRRISRKLVGRPHLHVQSIKLEKKRNLITIEESPC